MFSNKLIILILLPFFCFSQNKKKEVYFIVNKNHKEYKLPNHIVKSDVKSFSLYDSFSLYNIIEYKKRQKEIAKQKKEGSYFGAFGGGNRIPETLSFSVKSNKKEIITHCDIHNQDLKIVNYDWLKHNSWNVNNPNVVSTNIFFLFEIEKEKYIKYKVGRVLIAH